MVAQKETLKTVVKVVCISSGLFQARCKGPKLEAHRADITAGIGFWEDAAISSRQGSGIAISSHKLILVYFVGFKNHQCLSATHHSPAVLTANFNDLHSRWA